MHTKIIRRTRHICARYHNVNKNIYVEIFNSKHISYSLLFNVVVPGVRIGVDGRHLGGGSPSGIGQYTLAVLRAMAIAHPEHEFLILSTGSSDTAKSNIRKALEDLLERKNIFHIHRAVMNRALNLSILLFGRPSFETLFGKPVDVIWCPNLNFLPRSQSPIVVTFHDLSYATMPNLYSFKRRLWHRMVRPRKIAWQASAIIVPSKTTAMDLVRLYEITTPNPSLKRRGNAKPETSRGTHSQASSDSLRLPSIFGSSVDKKFGGDRRHRSKVTTPNPSLKRRGIEVIPHGVDETFSTHPEPQDHGVRSRYDLPRRYLLHVGTDEPRKNCVRLARAFQTAKNRSELMRRLDMKLVFAGSHPLPPTTYPLQPTPHSQDVLRLGYVPNADRPALYRCASALVFPSLYEGFGLPILEAFASGVPVITSQNSAMLEVGGNAALFVDPENEEDLARAIQELVEDQNLRDHLIREGLNRVELFSWQRTAEETLRVFEEAKHQITSIK